MKRKKKFSHQRKGKWTRIVHQRKTTKRKVPLTLKQDFCWILIQRLYHLQVRNPEYVRWLYQESSTLLNFHTHNYYIHQSTSTLKKNNTAYLVKVVFNNFVVSFCCCISILKGKVSGVILVNYINLFPLFYQAGCCSEVIYRIQALSTQQIWKVWLLNSQRRVGSKYCWTDFKELEARGGTNIQLVKQSK